MLIKYIGNKKRASVRLPVGEKSIALQTHVMHFAPGEVKELTDDDGKKLLELNTVKILARQLSKEDKKAIADGDNRYRKTAEGDYEKTERWQQVQKAGNGADVNPEPVEQIIKKPRKPGRPKKAPQPMVVVE